MTDIIYDFLVQEFPLYTIVRKRDSIFIRMNYFYSLTLMFADGCVLVHIRSANGMVQRLVYKRTRKKFIKLQEKLIAFLNENGICTKILNRKPV